MYGICYFQKLWIRSEDICVRDKTSFVPANHCLLPCDPVLKWVTVSHHWILLITYRSPLDPIFKLIANGINPFEDQIYSFTDVQHQRPHNPYNSLLLTTHICQGLQWYYDTLIFDLNIWQVTGAIFAIQCHLILSTGFLLFQRLLKVQGQITNNRI